MEKRIFISSTCFDLIDLRAELEQELRNLNLIPILSDSKTSEFEVQPDANSIETCLINLRKSAVVVIILSQRYGGSLKKSGFDDVSATHLEYREAMKNRIPVLFYVRDRLEADFNTYHKGKKDKSVLKWIKPSDVKIFDLFDEHKTLVNSNKNNWYYPFRDSIELKHRLRLDLKIYSGSAILETLAKTGQSPCIITKVSANWVTNSKTLRIDVSSQNVGNVVAIEPFINYYEGTEYKCFDANANDNPMNEKGCIGIKTLIPNDTSGMAFELELSDKNIGENKLDLIFETAYGTITGHCLADISYCQIQFDSHYRKVTDVHIVYNTKKYYHSSVINHLTEKGIVN